MSETPRLSVVIPCFNELANLENGCLAEVESYLETADFTWEVIIANDGSTDGSGNFVRAWCEDRDGWTALDVEHGGKPVAVWAGIRAAAGELVLFTDMDQSTPIVEWESLRGFYDEGYQVVIGSRGRERSGFNVLRQVGSSAFRRLRRSLILPEIEDTQCGFKSCTREAALRCFPRLQFFEAVDEPQGWKVSAYDVELLYLFKRSGYRIREVKVQWSNRDVSDTKDDVGGGVRRYLHESKEMLAEILRVKSNAMRGLYD